MTLSPSSIDLKKAMTCAALSRSWWDRRAIMPKFSPTDHCRWKNLWRAREPRLRYKHDSACLVPASPGFFPLLKGTGSMSIANRTLDAAANIVLSDCRMACEERLPRPLPNSSTPELRSSWAGSVMVFPLIEPIWTKRMRGSPSGDPWPAAAAKIASAEGPQRKSRTTCTSRNAERKLRRRSSCGWLNEMVSFAPRAPIPPALLDRGR